MSTTFDRRLIFFIEALERIRAVQLALMFQRQMAVRQDVFPSSRARRRAESACADHQRTCAAVRAPRRDRAGRRWSARSRRWQQESQPRSQSVALSGTPLAPTFQCGLHNLATDPDRLIQRRVVVEHKAQLHSEDLGRSDGASQERAVAECPLESRRIQRTHPSVPLTA